MTNRTMYTLGSTATIYDTLGDSERGPVADWREMIARVSELCLQIVYSDDPKAYPRQLNRRVLEDVLDTVDFPDNLKPTDVQSLSQAVSWETEHMLAVLGAALAMTWPESPLALAGWPERAIALSGLRSDETGIPVHPIGRELQAAGFGKQRAS